MNTPTRNATAFRWILPIALTTGLGAQTIWLERSTPGATEDATLTYFPPNGSSVLFGGRDGFTPRDRTAQFDGTLWQHVIPVGSPMPRNGHATAYDPTRQVLVMFGGSINGSGFSDETWQYDGVRWTQVTTVSAPTARRDHALAFDPNTGQILLFGGQGAFGFGNDTWSFDGTNWTMLQANNPLPGPNQPAQRLHHELATLTSPFPGLSRVVLYGGEGLQALPNTWTWDGTTWTSLPTSSPAQRWRHSMVGGGG